MKIIDLRSDKVTQPTENMRKAMAHAKLGDDVFEEDPTTIELQQTMARLTGHENALFVPSGTMGNLIAVLTHCTRGDEVILGDRSHTSLYEAGGISVLGGVHAHTVANQADGTMDLEHIKAAISPHDVHFPYTRLISLENTHNACGGCVLPLEYTNQVVELACEHELKVHLDGARIFNAAVALNVDVKKLASQVDSVNICLSKGLGAPVGSVLCGSNDFIRKARRMRKITGGGMRQCGVLAAAGLTALNEMIKRLTEDHKNAGKLAQGLINIRGLSVNLSSVQTNIVYFNLDSNTVTADQLVKRLDAKGIKILALGPKRLRAVTHYSISSDDIDQALCVFAEILQD